MPKKQARYSIAEKREFLVVKRNDLIQKSRHQLSAREQKVILYLISRVRPDDDNFTEQVFPVGEFCRICGIDENSGKNYANVKNTLKALRDRSVWILTDDNVEVLMGWVSTVEIDRNDGKITLRLDENLKPYLLELKKNFTRFNLSYALAMKSGYAVRLYELLKSYSNKKRVSFETDELKRLLDAQSYSRNNDFKRRVLETAVKEINELSDIRTEYRLIMSGRTFSEVEFSVRVKDAGERLEAWTKDPWHLKEAAER